MMTKTTTTTTTKIQHRPTSSLTRTKSNAAFFSNLQRTKRRTKKAFLSIKSSLNNNDNNSKDDDDDDMMPLLDIEAEEEEEDDDEDLDDEKLDNNSIVVEIRYNLILNFDEFDSSADKRALISAFQRMIAALQQFENQTKVILFLYSSMDDFVRDNESNNNNNNNNNTKTIFLDFSSPRDDDDDDDNEMKKKSAIQMHRVKIDNGTVIEGKRGKMVSLLPSNIEMNSNNNNNTPLNTLLKSTTNFVLQNKNYANASPADFVAHHLFASSIGAFKRSGIARTRKEIKDSYTRICLSRKSYSSSSSSSSQSFAEQKVYIFFNLHSKTSKWNAAQVYESLLRNKNMKPIPVAVVISTSATDSDSQQQQSNISSSSSSNLERSTPVWILKNVNDFYQCVYANSSQEAETHIFAKKSNKNTWPERRRPNLMIDFQRINEDKENINLMTTTTTTVGAFAQNFVSPQENAIVFICPSMMVVNSSNNNSNNSTSSNSIKENNENLKNDCRLRKIFQSAGIMFTGTSAALATRAADRVFMSSALQKLKIPGVKGIPKRVILQSALAVMADEPVSSNISRASRIFVESTKEFNSSELFIKSQFFDESFFKRVQSANDLELFAYECRKNCINNIQNNFVIEPYVETGSCCSCSCVGDDDESSSSASYEFVSKNSSSSRWLKIYAGGIGPEGKMKALDPMCSVFCADEKDDQQLIKKKKKFVYLDSMKEFNPLVVEENKTTMLLSLVKARIERVLNVTGISGCAMLRCFVNVDSGELIIEDVNHAPDMTEINNEIVEYSSRRRMTSSPFYEQACRYFQREEDVINDDDDSSKKTLLATKGLEQTSFFTRLIAIAMWKTP
jgi:hypothetical protein